MLNKKFCIFSKKHIISLKNHLLNFIMTTVDIIDFPTNKVDKKAYTLAELLLLYIKWGEYEVELEWFSKSKNEELLWMSNWKYDKICDLVD